jgi:hypothetical protein
MAVPIWWRLSRSLLPMMVIAGMLAGGSPPPVRADDTACLSGGGWTSRPAISRPAAGVEGTPGRGISLAVTSTEPPVFYLADPAYGVLRSQDCGTSWQRMASPPPEGHFGANAKSIAVDQAGRLYLPLYGEQPKMSDDGGVTWRRSGNVFYSDSDTIGSVPFAYAIGASPNIPGLAYAWIGTRAGTNVRVGARTTDGGATWYRIDHLCAGTRILVGRDPSVVYGAMLSANPTSTEQRYIYRSRVQGDAATCERYLDLPEEVTALAMSPDGHRFWAAVGNRISRHEGQGSSWEPVPDQPDVTGWAALAASPLEPATLYGIDQDGTL